MLPTEEYLDIAHTSSSRYRNIIVVLFLFLLLIGVGVYGLYRTTTPKEYPVNNSDTVEILSPIEVQQYRDDLPKDTSIYMVPEDSTSTPILPYKKTSVQESPTSAVTQPIIEPPSQIVSPPQSVQPPVHTNQSDGISKQGISNISTAPVPLPKELQTKPTVSTAGSFTTSGSGQGTLVLEDPSETGDKKKYAVQGVVYHVSPESNYLIMFDATLQRQFSVLLNDTTKVYISDKRTTLSAVESGDIVYIEGEGYESSERINATTVKVTAQEEIVIIQP